MQWMVLTKDVSSLRFVDHQFTNDDSLSTFGLLDIAPAVNLVGIYWGVGVGGLVNFLWVFLVAVLVCSALSIYW